MRRQESRQHQPAGGLPAHPVGLPSWMRLAFGLIQWSETAKDDAPAQCGGTIAWTVGAIRYFELTAKPRLVESLKEAKK